MARPLKIFMRGKRITMLQEILLRMGYRIEDQKGLFGTFTRDAVKIIQKQHGLKVNGEVDDALFQIIQGGNAPSPAQPEAEKMAAAPTSPITRAQLDALTRLLIRKGVLEEGELEAEIRKPRPASLI